MTGDLSDDFLRELFWYGRYEPATTWFLQQLLMPGDVFYDVGANIGYFALLAAATIKREGSVIAIEPNPIARERLVRNLEVNGFEHVMVRSEALGSAPGPQTLSQPLGRPEWSSLAPADGREAEGFPVEVRRLDDVVLETGEPPSVLKIDVEGWEGEVLLGAQAVLTSPHPPLIITEVSELLRSAPDEQVSRWLGDLQDRGYEFLKLSHRARTVGRSFRLTPWSPTMPRDPRELGFNVAAYIPDRHGERVRGVPRD